MAKRKNKNTMSDKFKEEYAQELGVEDKVKNYGYGELTSRECGNMVKRGLEKAKGMQNNQLK